jgi:secreted protein with Ig-like and vWFA domain
MNLDDPRITAYALGELDSAEEREAVEALLREHPQVATELEETRAIAGYLQKELKGDAGAPLTKEQRDHVIAVAQGAAPLNGRELSSGDGGAAASLPTPRKIITGPWYRRHWVPSAIAASVVVTTGAGLWSAHRYEELSKGRAYYHPTAGAEPSGTAKSSLDEAIVSLGDRITGADRDSREIHGLAPAAGGARGGADYAPMEPLANTTDRSKSLISIPLPEAETLAGAKVEKLMEEAESFNDTGRLDLAKKRAEQTLQLDAANGPALALKQEVEAKQKEYEASGYNHTRSYMTWQADKAWDRPVRRLAVQNGAAPVPAEAAPAPSPSSAPAAPALPQQVAQGRDSRVANPSSAVPADPYGNVADATRGGTSGTSTAWASQPGAIRFFRGEAPQSGSVTTAGRSDQLAYSLYSADHLQTSAPEASALGAVRLQSEASNTESYDNVTDNAFLAVQQNPLSTFSIDVDTASYANVRRFLTGNQRPPKGAVRIEELVNYFPYSYTPPPAESTEPFSAAMEVAAAPWAPQHRLVRIALKGREIAKEKLPPSNLVFLLDVSGSMQPMNKLPLVKDCMQQLVNELREQDSVGIVVYAGSSGVVLEPTSDKAKLREALSRLEAGGSTNGAAGIQAAYDLAQRAFKKGGNNRVVLATDGDFNVGVTNQGDLVDLIQRRAKNGVFLSVLGFGMGNTKDSTMEKLADKGNGNYAYVDSLREGRKVLVEEMSGTLYTIAKDVKIQVEFNPAKVSAYRLIGYENRLLAKEDFNDDTKDAGEIGAGHTVTALYEVVPAGVPAPVQSTVDPLKYQATTPALTLQTVPTPPAAGGPLRGDFSGNYYLLENQSTARVAPATPTAPPAANAPKEPVIVARQIAAQPSGELLTLKLRFKQPQGDQSTLKEFPLTDAGAAWNASSPDFRWAAAVASFGMLLRESPHRGSSTWDAVAELAREGLGEDRGGYRAEFLTLVDRARQLVPVTPLVTAKPETNDKPLVTDSKAALLMLPEFDVTDQSVLDAINALTKKSKELDEEKVGVSVVYAGPEAAVQKKVTFRMRNISVLEAARTIASSAGLKLEQIGPTLVLRSEG